MAFSIIVRRIVWLIPILIGISLISFLMLHAIPGDPAEAIVGLNITPDALEKTRKELGLDKPLYTQYFIYVKNIVQGNLGYSFRTNRPVLSEIKWRFPNSLKLAMFAMAITIVLGGTIGIFAGLGSGGFFDNFSTLTILILLSLPSFWVGTLFILLFTVHFGWFPSGGMVGVRSFILPGFTLAIPAAAYFSQMLKVSLIEVMEQDYIRTAWSKGAPKKDVVVKHALRNALIPSITMLGLQFGYILGGSVVVESIFSWPGLGRMIVTSITGRDYPMIQGGILVLAVTFILANLIVDIIYLYLDPRIKIK